MTGESRRIIRPIVDFPLPLSPISETTSPALHVERDVADRRERSPPNAPTL